MSSPTLRKALGISEGANSVSVKTTRTGKNYKVTITPYLHLGREHSDQVIGARIIISF